MTDIERLEDEENKQTAAAKRYPVGAKLVQSNGGPTGEIVAVGGNYGLDRTIRTAGVDRKTTVSQIDLYVESGRIKIEEVVA